jgi:hypothetical protein
MLTRLAGLLERGATHYGERNWEKGQPVSRTLSSLWRHVIAYQQGENTEDHLAAIVFNAMSIIHVEEEVANGQLDPSLLDLSIYNAQPEVVNEQDADMELLACYASRDLYSFMSYNLHNGWFQCTYAHIEEAMSDRYHPGTIWAALQNLIKDGWVVGDTIFGTDVYEVVPGKAQPEVVTE